MINNFIKSIFDGYKHSGAPAKKSRDWSYQELESYPMLFSSNYLNQMYDQAANKDDYESILTHIYRFGEVTSDVESYKAIEQKIIDRYWRG